MRKITCFMRISNLLTSNPNAEHHRSGKRSRLAFPTPNPREPPWRGPASPRQRNRRVCRLWRRSRHLHRLAEPDQWRTMDQSRAPCLRKAARRNGSPRRSAPSKLWLKGGKKSASSGFAKARAFANNDAESANARRVRQCHTVTTRYLLPRRFPPEKIIKPLS